MVKSRHCMRTNCATMRDDARSDARRMRVKTPTLSSGEDSQWNSG